MASSEARGSLVSWMDWGARKRVVSLDLSKALASARGCSKNLEELSYSPLARRHTNPFISEEASLTDMVSCYSSSKNRPSLGGWSSVSASAAAAAAVAAAAVIAEGSTARSSQGARVPSDRSSAHSNSTDHPPIQTPRARSVYGSRRPTLSGDSIHLGLSRTQPLTLEDIKRVWAASTTEVSGLEIDPNYMELVQWPLVDGNGHEVEGGLLCFDGVARSFSGKLETPRARPAARSNLAMATMGATLSASGSVGGGAGGASGSAANLAAAAGTAVAATAGSSGTAPKGPAGTVASGGVATGVAGAANSSAAGTAGAMTSVASVVMAGQVASAAGPLEDPEMLYQITDGETCDLYEKARRTRPTLSAASSRLSRLSIVSADFVGNSEGRNNVERNGGEAMTEATSEASPMTPRPPKTPGAKARRARMQLTRQLTRRSRARVDGQPHEINEFTVQHENVPKMTKVSCLQWCAADLDAKRHLVANSQRSPGLFSTFIHEVQRPYAPGHPKGRR